MGTSAWKKNFFIHKIFKIFKQNTIHPPREQRNTITKYELANYLRNFTSTKHWDPAEILGHGSYVVVVYSFSENQPNAANVHQWIQERILHEFSDSHTLQVEKNELATIFSNADREHIKTFLPSLADQLDREQNGWLTTISISATFNDHADLRAAYQQAKEMVLQATLSVRSQVVTESRVAPILQLRPEQDQAFSSQLQAGDTYAVIQTMNSLIDQLARYEVSQKQFHEFTAYVKIKAWMALNTVSINDRQTNILQELALIMEEYRSLKLYRESISNFLRAVTELIQESKEKSDPTASLVMEILNNRYSQDLSLSQIADKLSMSSAYLSVYIKEKTGANFSDHLNGIRVQKAQELLISSDYSISDISRRVGYVNLTSFTRMFKKQTSLSPGEFRKQQITQLHKIG